MSWLNALERRLAPLAVPNLTLYLVIGQTFVLLTTMLGVIDLGRLVFVPELVKAGEVWRLATFLLVPPPVSPLFVAFALYIFYLFGNTLEQHWGALRYTLFLLFGWALTVGLAFLAPRMGVSNLFLAGSVFLAFAYLNPDFVMYLFFVLPVKIKWLALLTWVMYGWTLIVGDWSQRLGVLAATGNFLLFLGPAIVRDMQAGRRHMKAQAWRTAARVEERGPRHRCVVCGKNSDTHPDLDFRYCSKCEDDACYCPEHIGDHEHRVASAEKPRT